MTGRHRGGRSLRLRLIVAVLAAGAGRGYTGRHRLAEAALGRRVDTVTAHVQPVDDVSAAPVLPQAPGRVPGLVLRRPVDGVVIASSAPEPARLSVVPLAAAPDPLADTLPHPVVTLFPLTPAERVADVDAVFADVDAEREHAVTIDLAAAEGEPAEYSGRHTA
ncbi:hypothetical protein [Angustibacter aerolatus]